MKKITIVLVALLLMTSVLAACAPGDFMGWLSNIGGASGGDAYYATSANAGFVTDVNALFASAGNVALATGGNATSGNAVLATGGNAVLLPTPVPTK